MRALLLTFCLFPILGAIAQDTTRIYFPSGKLAALQVRSKPDTTLLWERDFWENGQLRGEFTAIKQGTDRAIILKGIEYDDSGRLFVRTDDTSSILYEPDGSIHMLIRLKNHLKDGQSKYWLNGKLFLTIDYKEDKKDGWEISYNDDGSIFSKTRNRNDKQDGPTLSYDKKGKLKKSIDYAGGCPVKVTYFNTAGKPVKTLIDKRTIWFEEGKPIGCK